MDTKNVIMQDKSILCMGKQLKIDWGFLVPLSLCLGFRLHDTFFFTFIFQRKYGSMFHVKLLQVIRMKYQVLFSLNNEKFSRLLSTAVVIGALRVNELIVIKHCLIMWKECNNISYEYYKV